MVWWHNFDAASEVTQFRWSGGYNGGNDPLGLGGPNVSWVSSGGADGGGFLRLTYTAGSSNGSTYWWRPFAPLTGAGNGRGVADPAASGAIATQAFAVSDGSSTMLDFGKVSNPGWYGSASDQAANPTKYHGNDYWLQVRERRLQKPGPPPDNVSGGYFNITGKSIWLTTTTSTYTTQEIVNYGQSASEDVVGTQGRHRAYGGYNYNPFGGSQDNETVTISNLTVGWRYSGGWDTLLFHVTPGPDNGTGANRTHLEIWAQHDLDLFPAESGQWTKIWDTVYTAHYDTGSNSSGSPNYPGWNAVIMAIYHNGSTFGSTFTYDYDQVIFSKATIAAPTL